MHPGSLNASWESECMHDVITVFSLLVGLLAVCMHAGRGNADHSNISRLLASSALVWLP